MVAAAHVNQQHDGEFSLFLEYLHVRVIQSSRDVPVDAAHVITILVFTHLAESHAPSLECTMVFAGKELARKTSCLDLDFSNLFYDFAILFHFRFRFR